VLAAGLLFLLVGGIWGTGGIGTLSGGGGFDAYGSESVRANALLAGPLGRDQADVVVMYSDPDRTVDDPAFAEAVQDAVAQVPLEHVSRIQSFWTNGDPDFVSTDRHSTYVTVQLASADDQENVAHFVAIRDILAAPGLDVKFGGVTAMTQQVNSQTSADIARIEIISVPLLLILLTLVFGSVIAAAMPVALGILAAVGSLAALHMVSLFVELSTFAIQTVTILGLGLAIDYALLIVSRFREELARGQSVDDAIHTTVATAGRAVAVSGLIVCVSLLGLLLFPSRFLQSMGYAGATVVLFAALGSLTVLPALLRVVGRRVNALRIPLPGATRRAAVESDPTEGRWYRIAHAVMRRPILSITALVVALLLVGAPLAGANWARPGEWVLPASADARQVTPTLAAEFDGDPSRIVTAAVTLPAPAESAAMRAELAEYAARLATVPGVTHASVTGTYDQLARISIGYRIDPMSPAAWTLVENLRAQEAPTDAETLLTGMPASRVDIVSMIGANLPWLALWLLAASVVLLFLAFGSLVLPIKSFLMNLLSLSASFGVVIVVFQYGWFVDLFGFTPSGAIDANFPVLILAIAFGLSMDYEVFLLSRIREERLSQPSGDEAIAVATQRTARVITAAAMLMIVVVGGFATSSIALMQMLGIGLTLAVIIDATVVRGLLMPAVMKLLGPWAWWAPAPLARLTRHRIRV
jgi:RND superfamily putative drug exporter